jgi:uncharacterized membrane protein YdfJ with MMPL/SSD domain
MRTIDWTAKKKPARLVSIATLQKRDDDEATTLEETIPLSLSLSLSLSFLLWQQMITIDWTEENYDTCSYYDTTKE